jgi:hypothetical protein
VRRDVRGGRAAGERREERVERALGGREAVEVLAEARALHDWVPRKGGDEGVWIDDAGVALEQRPRGIPQVRVVERQPQLPRLEGRGVSD